jgi:hypothetical protein
MPGIGYPGESGAAPSSAFTILASPEGGWLMTTRPKAWYSASSDRTYFAYVKGDNGDVRIAYWDHATETASTPTTLHSALESDTHATPSIALRQSDSKIMAVYSRHLGPDFFNRISSSAESIASFAAETDMDDDIGGSAYTYPMLWELGDENTWHLWYRSGSATLRWARVTSVDDGANWSAGEAIIDVPSVQDYIITQKTSEARIDILVSNGAPGVDTNASLFHLYYEGDAFFDSDDVEIVDALPMSTTNMTVVYPSAGNSGVRAIDVQKVGADIYALFYVFHSSSDARYYWGHFDGTWATHEVADDAEFEDNAWLTGGACIDPANPTTVYASRNVSGDMQMFKYVTADDGDTWTATQLTTDIGSHHHTPIVPVNRDDSLRCLWLTGSPFDPADYEAGIAGIAV